MKFIIYEIVTPEHLQSKGSGEIVVMEYSKLNDRNDFETMNEAVNYINNEGFDFVSYTVQMKIYNTPY